VNWVEIIIPPSANAMYKSVRGRRFASAEYTNWLKIVAPQLDAECPVIETYPVAIEVMVLGGKGLRAGSDLDNLLKPIGDALHGVEVMGKRFGAQIIEDDDAQHVADWRVRFVPADQHFASARPSVKPTKRAISELEARCFVRVTPIASAPSAQEFYS
jgi:Holliday junction resolvase RusA-like endonuclease